MNRISIGNLGILGYSVTWCCVFICDLTCQSTVQLLLCCTNCVVETDYIRHIKAFFLFCFCFFKEWRCCRKNSHSKFLVVHLKVNLDNCLWSNLEFICHLFICLLVCLFISVSEGARMKRNYVKEINSFIICLAN